MSSEPTVTSSTPRPPGRLRRDPVLAVSAGFAALCLLLGLSALVSPGARAFYQAGFEALHEAMAGMAAACQWVL